MGASAVAARQRLRRPCGHGHGGGGPRERECASARGGIGWLRLQRPQQRSRQSRPVPGSLPGVVPLATGPSGVEERASRQPPHTLFRATAAGICALGGAVGAEMASPSARGTRRGAATYGGDDDGGGSVVGLMGVATAFGGGKVRGAPPPSTLPAAQSPSGAFESVTFHRI